MKLIFELSGEHPAIPCAEISCMGTVLEFKTQVAVAECPVPHEAGRLALSHNASEYLGSCGATRPELEKMLNDLDLTSEVPFAVRVRKIFGNSMQEGQQELERLVGSMIKGRVYLDDPRAEYRLVVSEDRCYLGRLVLRIDRAAFDLRRPGSREFFHPGVMMPRMARALVNLSGARRGEWMLDPFCGTGGIVLEAGMLGINAVGSDIDPVMGEGSRKNTPEAEIVLADSTSLPFSDASFDAVVSDLPYGQSVSVQAESFSYLYLEALGEIRRVLHPGRMAVMVTHKDISTVAAKIMPVVGKFEQRVHKSLTRRILVMKKS